MQLVKNPPANVRDARDVGLIPGSGRSPGEGNGNPIQNSCLRNPMDRGAWWATVHEIAKSWIPLNTHTHTLTHTQTLKWRESRMKTGVMLPQDRELSEVRREPWSRFSLELSVLCCCLNHLFCGTQLWVQETNTVSIRVTYLLNAKDNIIQ